MMQIRHIVFVAALAAAIFLPPVMADSVGLGLDVSPAKLEIAIPSGQSYNIPVTVHNSSGSLTTVQASLVDFGVAQNGSYEYDRVGTRSNSLMRWATINPRQFDLPADTTQQVQLTITVPNDVHLSGEYAGIAFFQTRPVRGKGGTIAFSARVASKIYETIPGTVTTAGAIVKMNSISSPLGQTYRVLFHNSGNVHVYLNGQIDVQQNGKSADRITIQNSLLVERGGDRLIEVQGKKLPPGSYQAIATIDYGGKTETGGAIQFDVR